MSDAARADRRPPFARRVVVVDVLAIAVSIGWFAYNVTLPDAYNGRLCCDSTNYMRLASRIGGFGATFPSVLWSCGHASTVYPIFLRAHLLLHDALGLPARPDWISLSLGSAFVLFVASAYALYHAARGRGLRVPRCALWLLLLHPGLVSYAATPITDSVALSLLLLLFACVLRLEWTFRRRDLSLAVAIGLVLAAVVLTRPTHYFAAVVFLGALCVAGIAQAVRGRSVGLLLLPLLTAGCFAGTTLPRHLACRHIDGTFRFVLQADMDRNLLISFGLSRIGARSYAWVSQKGKGLGITVPDPYIQAHFGCLPSAEPILPGMLACFRDQALFVPGYLGKKVVALFDIMHLSPYAAEITTPAVRWWNRLFSMLGFAGLVSMVPLATWAVAHRRLALQVALPLLYLGAYLVASLVPHIEARYGLPLVPPSIVALTLLAQQAREPGWKRWAVGTLLVGACSTFLAQTVAWDRADPLLLTPPAPLSAGSAK